MEENLNLNNLVVAGEIVQYWIEKNVNRVPPIGEVLFPMKKEIGVKLEWIKGSNEQPVALRLSAYDSKSIRRDREGFEIEETKMPFFKESMVIDEEMRQNLNTLRQTNNQALIDQILNRIFADQVKLIDAAYQTLEIMRMQLVTTGKIVLSSNGQSYSYDYGMPAENKITVEKSWSDPTADIITFINEKIIKPAKANGYKITRAMCNSKVANYIAQNNAIKNSIYILGQGLITPTTKRALQYIYEETGVLIEVNDDVYKGEDNTTHNYFPDDVISFFPEGNLGYTHFGVTPEESDLINSQVANVSLIDNAIAVTTRKLVDPVNVETKVSMVALPSFEMADAVYIVDVITE